jgi:hypothetical protein
MSNSQQKMLEDPAIFRCLPISPRGQAQVCGVVFLGALERPASRLLELE